MFDVALNLLVLHASVNCHKHVFSLSNKTCAEAGLACPVQGYCLHAKWVIHAVGPQNSDGALLRQACVCSCSPLRAQPINNCSILSFYRPFYIPANLHHLFVYPGTTAFSRSVSCAQRSAPLRSAAFLLAYSSSFFAHSPGVPGSCTEFANHNRILT